MVPQVNLPDPNIEATDAELQSLSRAARGTAITPIQIDPLPFEDLGLTVERQMIPELCDDGEPSWRHRFEPDGERR